MLNVLCIFAVENGLFLFSFYCGKLIFNLHQENRQKY